MLFIVRSGSTIQGAQFLYRGTVVWLVVIEQDALEHQLMTPDLGWEYWMGILSSTVVLYGESEYLQTLLRMGHSVPATKFREELEDSLSWIMHEQFGRIKSCAVRRNSYDVGNAVVEVLADMRGALCLLNQRWTTHSHKTYQGFVDTFDFEKLPEGYREIIPLLLAPQKDIDQTVLPATTLVENFWELLVIRGDRIANRLSDAGGFAGMSSEVVRASTSFKSAFNPGGGLLYRRDVQGGVIRVNENLTTGSG